MAMDSASKSSAVKGTLWVVEVMRLVGLLDVKIFFSLCRCQIPRTSPLMVASSTRRHCQCNVALSNCAHGCAPGLSQDIKGSVENAWQIVRAAASTSFLSVLRPSVLVVYYVLEDLPLPGTVAISHTAQSVYASRMYRPGCSCM